MCCGRCEQCVLLRACRIRIASECEFCFTAETERVLDEERKSVRLQILEAREEVRQKAEVTLDEMRSQRERMRGEFSDTFQKKD